MAADAMSGGLKGAFSGEGHCQLGAGRSRKKSGRQDTVRTFSRQRPLAASGLDLAAKALATIDPAHQDT